MLDLDAEELALVPFDEASNEIQLSPRKELFISEYLIDCNIAQASLRAGVDRVTAGNWLQDPSVASRLKQAIAQRLTRTGIKQDQVLHDMSLLALSRLDWFVIDDKGQVSLTQKAPEGAMGAVATIKRKARVFPGKGDDPGYTEYDVEIRMYDKVMPLRLMGRHVGLFPDKVEHTGPGGGPIETVTRIERVIIRPDGQDPPP